MGKPSGQLLRVLQVIQKTADRDDSVQPGLTAQAVSSIVRQTMKCAGIIRVNTPLVKNNHRSASSINTPFGACAGEQEVPCLR